MCLRLSLGEVAVGGLVEVDADKELNANYVRL